MSTRSIRFAFVLALVAMMALPVFAGEKGCSMKGDDHAHAADHAHGDCPMKHAEAVSREEVELTGQLLCRHCNLHETDSCEKVFVSEDETRYALCPEGDIQAAESISEHGEATIVVKGMLMTLEDGTSILRIASAEHS